MVTNQFDKITFKSLFATTIKEKEDVYVVSELFSRYNSIQERQYERKNAVEMKNANVDADAAATMSG